MASGIWRVVGMLVVLPVGHSLLPVLFKHMLCVKDLATCDKGTHSCSHSVHSDLSFKEKHIPTLGLYSSLRLVCLKMHCFFSINSMDY